MNINNKNILNNLLYKNLSQNINLEDKNMLDKSLDSDAVNSEKVLTNTNLQNNIDEELKIILSNFNKPINKENINLIKFLIQNGLHINKENIDTVIKANKILKQNPLEKALFLIENNLKPTQNNLNQLDNYISNNVNISKQLEEIFSDLELNNIEDKTQVLNNLLKNTRLSNDVKDIVNLKENIKLTLAKNIFNDNTIIGNNIKNSLNELINNNKVLLNKENILNAILDNLIEEKNILNFNKSNLLDIINSFSDDKLSENKNLLSNEDFIKFTKSLKIFNDENNKDLFKNIQKNIFDFIKKDENIKLHIKDFIDKSKNIENKIKYFDFKSSTVEDLGEFIKDIKTISKNIENNILNFNHNNENVLKNLDNLNKNLDFMLNLKNSVFLQIPLNINNFSTTADLYVFSDKKNTNGKNNKKTGSALISLNLAYLGKLEAYIIKNDKDIMLQFRLENESSENILKQNIELLQYYLKEKNLILKDIYFKKLDESFNLITKYIKNNNSKNDLKISNFNAKA